MRPASATLEVEIERILPGGLGLGHAAGQTIFVSLAAPGDFVRVSVDRVAGKVAFASIKEVLKPSAQRVEPPCPYFGRCGGCDFQHLGYEAQLRAKSEMIRDCLRRIAHIENVPEVAVVASPKQWHYRGRANWQVDGERIGYYERSSHKVCDVVECAILTPELQQALGKLRALTPRSLPGKRLSIEATAGEEGISLDPPAIGLPKRNVARRIGAYVYEFSATAFFQINHDLLESLVTTVANDASGETAVDLYCGAGLFTLPLARRFGNVTGVEASVTASRFARQNLSRAGLTTANIITARAGDWLKGRTGKQGNGQNSVGGSAAPRTEKSRAGVPLDFLILDPPRTGAERGTIDSILTLHPKRICYVSCDPATLARDLKSLLSGGYSLDSVSAFDMFPQTHHVETVVHLTGDG